MELMETWEPWTSGKWETQVYEQHHIDLGVASTKQESNVFERDEQASVSSSSSFHSAEDYNCQLPHSVVTSKNTSTHKSSIKNQGDGVIGVKHNIIVPKVNNFTQSTIRGSTPINKRYYNDKQKRRAKTFWHQRKLIKNDVLATIISTRDMDKRPYVNVDINGGIYQGLLDSGATISILGLNSERFMTDSSIPFSHCVSYAQTADGQPQRIFGYITVPIKFNHEVHIMRLHIVPSLEQELILGIDFWNIFHIVPTLSCVNAISSSNMTNTDESVYHHLTVKDQHLLTSIKDKFPSFER